MITSAFTCTGPYAILILLGIKRVENRSAMPVPAKGWCAVSCSKSFRKEEYGRFVAWAAANLPEGDFERLPSWGDVRDWPGKVVGCCDYEARTARPESAPYQWDEGCGCWWELSEAIVVAHNHPSGDATSSVQDRELTASLKRLGETLGVPVLDHLILGGESFTSI